MNRKRFMGYWNNTLYINADAPSVGEALIALMRAEGRVLVHPPRRVRDEWDVLQYGCDDEWRMGAAVFPGAPGWTVVKTAPLEWMLYRGRLPTLCREMGGPAFQHNVYDGDSDTLVEADASGTVAVSGFCSSEIERFRGRQPEMDEVHARFSLVDVGPAVRLAREAGLADAADAVERMTMPDSMFEDLQERSEALAVVFGGQSAEYADNLYSVHHLVVHEPLPPTGTAVYFDRVGVTARGADRSRA